MQEEELVEPSLDNIDYDEEDSLPEEIEVPVIEDLVVDPTSASFIDDEIKTDSEEIDDSAMRYLEDQPQADVLEEMVIEEYLPADIKDEDVIESYIEPDITSPVKEVFQSKQWDEEYEVESEPTTEEHFVANTMQEEIKDVLAYMDRLLESLPEEKITEFAQSEYFDRYKKLFSDLGIS